MDAGLFSNFICMTLQATGNNNVWGTILNGSAFMRTTLGAHPAAEQSASFNHRLCGRAVDRLTTSQL